VMPQLDDHRVGGEDGAQASASLLQHGLDWAEKLLVSQTRITSCGTREDFDGFLRDARGAVVVAQFTAPWCKACDAVNALTVDLARRHGRDVAFAKVDAGETGPGLCRDLGVKKLPWFQIYSPEGELLVSVHASRRNQKLIPRQVDQLKVLLLA